MPLLIIGSLFIIISDFPVEAYQAFMAGIFGEGWGDFVWNDVFVATTSLIAVIATFGIAKSLVDSYDLDGIRQVSLPCRPSSCCCLWTWRPGAGTPTCSVPPPCSWA